MKGLAKNKIGLTLIEVMAAVAIFAIVIIPISNYFVSSRQRARNTLLDRQALAVAEARLESLRDDKFRQLFVDAGHGDIVIEEVDGKFHIEIRASYDQDVNMTEVTVTVSCQGREVSLSTLASKHRR